MSKKRGKKNGNAVQSSNRDALIATPAEKRLDILIGAVLFVFGVYQSIIYFGHTIVPISDFTSILYVGKKVLSLQMPSSFKYAPVVGILQNLLIPVAWGTSHELTAGWLLNAILHPFSVVLLWLVGRRIIGRSAVWFALIASINPWTINFLTEPIVESPYLFFILLTLYLIFIRSRWAYLLASVTTVVRYEGAALILAAFVADVIHRRDRRDVIKAVVYSFLASVPLIIWLVLTVVTWQGGNTHYFTVLFSKDYSKTFAEGQGQRGIGLHLNLLWQVAFQPLFIPYSGASAEFMETFSKLNPLGCVVGFVSGCVFSIIRRRWEILVLLLFFVPYFLLHAYYPYPLTRFHSDIFWIALLVVWFGLQSVGGFLAEKARLPWQATMVLKIGVAIASGLWFANLARSFGLASAASPDSASMPYVSMLVAGIIIAARMLLEHPIQISRHLCVASVLCLIIASNQFVLARYLGDGKREIEFKMLGEWFAEKAGPDDKMAVYNDTPTALYAGKYAANVTGFPKEDSPEKLTEKLYEQKITYVVWATREGIGQRHNDYRFLNLDKNIAMLNQPRSIGPYEFVTQVGNERGYVNIFQLKKRSPQQGPVTGG